MTERSSRPPLTWGKAVVIEALLIGVPLALFAFVTSLDIGSLSRMRLFLFLIYCAECAPLILPSDWTSSIADFHRFRDIRGLPAGLGSSANPVYERPVRILVIGPALAAALVLASYAFRP
jgi:hypothetical protein